MDGPWYVYCVTSVVCLFLTRTCWHTVDRSPVRRIGVCLTSCYSYTDTGTQIGLLKNQKYATTYTCHWMTEWTKGCLEHMNWTDRTKLNSSSRTPVSSADALKIWNTRVQNSLSTNRPSFAKIYSQSSRNTKAVFTADELNWTELTCTKLTQLHDTLLVTRVGVRKLIGRRSSSTRATGNESVPKIIIVM